MTESVKEEAGGLQRRASKEAFIFKDMTHLDISRTFVIAHFTSRFM